MLALQRGSVWRKHKEHQTSLVFKGSKLKYLLCALPKLPAPPWRSGLGWPRRCWLLKAFSARLLTQSLKIESNIIVLDGKTAPCRAYYQLWSGECELWRSPRHGGAGPWCCSGAPRLHQDRPQLPVTGTAPAASLFLKQQQQEEGPRGGCWWL